MGKFDHWMTGSSFTHLPIYPFTKSHIYPFPFVSDRDFLRGVLVGAEAEQRAYASGTLQCGIAIDEPDISAIADGKVHQRIGNIAHFTGLLAADRTGLHHASVEMTAVGTLHGLCLEVAAHKQGLDFLALQRVEHVAQAHSTAGIALRLAGNFTDQSLLLRIEMLSQNAFGVLAHFVSTDEPGID